jgi:hypothetical protein
MSYLTQMLVLSVQNFLSAATGIAVVFALFRGFAARATGAIGNFWVDVTRITAWLLLPLSLVFAIFLVGQGVIQNFRQLQGCGHAGNHVLPGRQNRPRRPGPERRQGQCRDGRRQDRQADPGHGPGRVAGGHQDAGHQRRRLLQRQLGPSV